MGTVVVLAWPREVQHLQARPAKQANRPKGGRGGQGPIRGITLYAYIGDCKYSLATLLENNREVKYKIRSDFEGMGYKKDSKLFHKPH